MKELRLPLAAAAGAVLLLLLLFRPVDPAGKYPLAIDRAQAVQRAARLSASYGVATTGWRADATTITDDKLRSYLEAYPSDSAARLFTPIDWGVRFTAPDRRIVRVRLSGDGKPRQFEFRGHGAPSPAQETVLADFAGAYRGEFHSIDSASPPGVRRQSWSYGDEHSLLTATLDIDSGQDEYVIKLTPSYASGYRRPDEKPAYQAHQVAAGFLGFAGFCVAVVLALSGWSRGVYSWRAPAGLAVVIVLWTGFMLVAGPGLQDIRYGQSVKVDVQTTNDAQRQRVNVTLNTVPPATFFGSTVGPLIGLFVLAGASYTVTRGRYRRKWETLELLLRGKIFTRQVARPIALGGLWGVAAAALPYAVGVLFASRGGMSYRPFSLFSAPVAASQLLQPGATLFAFGFLGFAWPWAAQFRSKPLRVLTLALIAIDLVLSAASAFDSVPAGLIASTVTGAAWFLIYQRIDLLALVSARLAARAAIVAAAFVAQPVPDLRESGAKLLVLLGAAATVFVYYAVRGRDAYSGPDAADLLSIEPEDSIALRSRSSRERLEAEFQVARQAQRDALPASAPAVEGYSLSAACEPARQVGGDLYDYFPLPDGRLGIAVADVSGKGVPAALYMMVTKGLLAAAAQDSSDLAGILKGINAHLYRACKRKVFVTMAAIAVEPGGRSAEYARAGHNPIIWRRTRRGETVMVKPGGLGLGLSGSEQFGRSLRLERLELEPGDAVVLYSDGVTEAVNATLDQFGEDRLIRAVEQTDGRSADETRIAILRDLAAFTGDTPAWDDITLVALRVGDTQGATNG